MLVYTKNTPSIIHYYIHQRLIHGSHTKTPSKKSSIGVLSPRLGGFHVLQTVCTRLRHRLDKFHEFGESRRGGL